MRSQLASLQEYVPQQPHAHHHVPQASGVGGPAGALRTHVAATAAATTRTGAGAELSVASADGAGRQLLAATGRVVAAAAVATAVSEQVQLAQAAAAAAAAPAATARHGQRRAFDPLHRHAGQAQQGEKKPRWSTVNLLLAPLVPLLRSLAAPSRRAQQGAAREEGASTNGYDMLLDVLSSLAAGVQVRVRLWAASCCCRPCPAALARLASFQAQHAHGGTGSSQQQPIQTLKSLLCSVSLLLHRAMLATTLCATCWPPPPPRASRATTLSAAWWG